VGRMEFHAVGADLLGVERAVQDYWQNIVRGALIIIAVAIGLVVERR
jgi:predicted ABC-type sugar transport system permease subunit